MKQASDLAQQFAQALANGELDVNDIGYVLEHVDGFLMDKHWDVNTWMPRTFESVADELYEAQRIVNNQKELEL